MNTELLNKIKRAILRWPDKLDMSYGLMADTRCGTAGCIAGHAYAYCVAKGFRLGVALKTLIKTSELSPFSRWTTIKETSSESLGLDTDSADRLYHVANWPYAFKQDFRLSTTAKGQAEATARRIDHFINTGGRE